VQLYCHTTEAEQVMAHLLAEIRTSQAKMDATLKELKSG
jgi:hypothetical protein